MENEKQHVKLKIHDETPNHRVTFIFWLKSDFIAFNPKNKKKNFKVLTLKATISFSTIAVFETRKTKFQMTYSVGAGLGYKVLNSTGY